MRVDPSGMGLASSWKRSQRARRVITAVQQRAEPCGSYAFLLGKHLEMKFLSNQVDICSALECMISFLKGFTIYLFVMAAPVAYGCSWASDWILRNSSSNAKSFYPWAGPGIEPVPLQRHELLQLDPQPTAPQWKLLQLTLFTVFPKTLANLHSQHQRRRAPAAPGPHKLGFLCLLNFGHSGGCIIISLCAFKFHFHSDPQMINNFSYVYWSWNGLFWKYPFRHPAQFPTGLSDVGFFIRRRSLDVSCLHPDPGLFSQYHDVFDLEMQAVTCWYGQSVALGGRSRWVHILSLSIFAGQTSWKLTVYFYSVGPVELSNQLSAAEASSVIYS